MINRNKGKKIITALLAASCIVSGIILASSNPKTVSRLQDIEQIDSLITIQFANHQVLPDQVNNSVIRVDTLLKRRTYWVNVPSRFSKTMFHIDLNNELSRYEIDSPAKVNFPSRDMNIYIYKYNTVLRTIRITTDTDLDSLSTESD
jgi:hypothetical protein